MAKIESLLTELEDREKKTRLAKEKISQIEQNEQEIKEKMSKLQEIEGKKKVDSASDFSVTCSIKEKKVDEKTRTVRAGVLEKDSLSANNRFYPAEIVTKAIEGLTGKRSLVGHDTDDVRDVVAKITSSGFEGAVGFAEFQFGTDEVSEQIFSKVKEGLIDSVSIRANGSSKRAKMGEIYVDVVEYLDILTVDWVLEGGVASAKVMKVFESAPNFVYENEQKEREQMEELKKQIEEQAKKITALEAENKALAEKLDASEKKVKESEDKAKAAELESHKESLLSSVEDAEVRTLIKSQLTAVTKEEIGKQFEAQVKHYKAIAEKAGSKAPVIRPTDEKKGEGFNSVREALDSDKLSQDEKAQLLSATLG